MKLVPWLAGTVLVALGCTVDPFDLDPVVEGGANAGDAGDFGNAPRRDGGEFLIDGSPGVRGDGGLPIDGSRGDGGPCEPRRERCNERDDDCDGKVDEDFDLERDPEHCGECGTACDLPHTTGTCAKGECSFECLPGFIEIDGKDETGCEYACVPSATGTEACNHRDDDCDGRMDETFDLATDEKNCGGCGIKCPNVHGDPVCKKGACTYPKCDSGFADVLPEVPGCEYACPDTPPGAETCDTRDNDCDGEIDEDVAGTGVDCTDPGFELQGDKGSCSFGRMRCVAGEVRCVGYVGPQASEICNNQDDNCDGLTDEGYDKLGDTRYCEACAGCSLDNAVAACTAGTCGIAACFPGFVDFDMDDDTGCEYECTPTGPEVCDGLDNDCDKLTDGADPDLVEPVTNFCHTLGACTGVEPTCAASACDAKVTWRCVYPADVETADCAPLLQEAKCDEVDGDCDGRVDETFPLKDTACDDGGVGVCQGKGTFVCNGTEDALTCDITMPGGTSSMEVCNGRDDDCDGSLDDGAVDDLVHVVVGAFDFWMYRYEASRPDASPTSSGRLEHRACSSAGVLPWNRIDHAEAAQACTDAGMRLCSEAEWAIACEGAVGYAFPYGDDYDPNACNGADHDMDCTLPNADELLPTGETLGCPPAVTTSCVSPVGAVDMSGNLHEWTSEQVSAMPVAFRARGGGYQTIDAGLTCQHDFIAFEEHQQFDTLGFRCCSDMEPVPP